MTKEVSVVLPCRNEEKAIGICIKRVQKIFKQHNIDGEIIVSDSSKDRSPDIARSLGAKVVKHDKKGYGIAYMEGFKVAQGKYIICADADGTYDFDGIPKFLFYLRKGYDFVIGNRFKGKMQKGAMPFLHKYLGNPILSGLLRIFFNLPIRDAHCGIRGIRKDALNKLNLKTTGMEFASEMIMKAARHKLRMKEVPVNYFKRIGPSKLNSFSDGWRHLRFMLMYAPNYLFIIPGLFFFFLGSAIMATFLAGPFELFGLTLYSHPIIAGSFLIILGYQIIIMGIFARTFAISTGLVRRDKLIEKLASLIKFESGIYLGGGILLMSFLYGAYMLVSWIAEGFPGIIEINKAVFILTLAVIGIQTIFSAFFLSIMLVDRVEN